MWQRVVLFLELIRFSHTVFALPFALLAAVLAWTANAHENPPVPFRVIEVVGLLWCIVFARSAAMAFNRLVDWKFDTANPRTKNRHLPAGLLSGPAVVGFAVVCSVGFVLGTLWFWPNPLPLILSGPVLILLLGYSYTKRFTALAHFWLGAALMLAPVSAWLALRGQAVLDHPADLLPALVLGSAVLTWVAGFDIIYACQDADFDREAGLHSIPARLGVAGALRLAAGCHALTVALLLALPACYPGLETVYLLGVLTVAGLLIYEHRLVRADDLTRVNVAFFQVNAIISVGLLLLVVVELYLL